MTIQIMAELYRAKRAKDALDRERKRRRRENRRRVMVKCIGGFLAFVGINGSFFILMEWSGIPGLLFDEWSLWSGLCLFLLCALYLGYAVLVVITFFWLSAKAGFEFWIEDWITGWDDWEAQQSDNIFKFKKFPRRQRKGLVRSLNKELDVITDKLMDLEEEANENRDEKLSDSVQSLNQLILGLYDVSSGYASLLKDRASWRVFALTLEETFKDLESELVGIAKYHEKVQSLLKQGHKITAKVLFRIIG